MDDSFPGNGNLLPTSTAAKATIVSFGTASSNVTVPWLGLPPFTVAGNKARLLNIPAMTDGFMVRVAEAELVA